MSIHVDPSISIFIRIDRYWGIRMFRLRYTQLLMTILSAFSNQTLQAQPLKLILVWLNVTVSNKIRKSAHVSGDTMAEAYHRKSRLIQHIYIAI